MYQKKPLFWHQGLFLQPQHFQLADLHQQHKLNIFRDYGHPYFWGVTDFSIRKQSLESRVFDVKCIDVLFADGNFVSFPDNALLAPRSFDKAWHDGNKPFVVYLGLKRWNDEGNNTTVEDSDSDSVGAVNTMFSVSPNAEDLPDLLGGGPVGQIKPMNYVLRLFWETEIENLGAYQLIPLASLEMEGGQVVLDDTFVPPALTMRASGYLYGLLQDVTEQMASRIRKLEQYKTSITYENNFNFNSTIYLLALRSLNRYVPQLRHLSLAPHVHPWSVFGLLVQIVGELSTFSNNITAFGETKEGEKLVPDYDHQNPAASLSASIKVISEILDTLTLGPEFIGRFTFDDPYYSLQIPQRVLTVRHSFWLQIQTDDPQAMSNKVLSLAKLSATNGMSVLLARAVRGIPLSLVDNPPAGLPQNKNSIYFRVDIDSPLWKEVEKTQTLSLYWDSTPLEMTASLVVLRGERQ